MPSLLFALLLLAACSLPAAQTAPAGAATPASAPAQPTQVTNPDAAALSANPAEGAWGLNGDGATVGACFGPPQSECTFTVICNGATNQVRLMFEHELAPDQDTRLRIITEARTVEFPARSFNEGLPSVDADVPGNDPRLAALSAQQERFGVEVNGEITVFPWHDSIARTLSNCAG